MKCRFSLSYRELEEIDYIRGATISQLDGSVRNIEKAFNMNTLFPIIFIIF